MPESSSRYAWYVLAILTLTQLINYIDRQVIAPLLPYIKIDLHLTDTQLGLLGTGFMIVHSLTAIPLGVASDYFERRKIIALGLGFWSIATVFSGFAKTFSHLMGARAAIGVGEAAYAPAATSMLNDLFPKEKWGRVISIFNAGLFMGGALGLIFGGILVKKIGWQNCFFLVGIPGLFLSVINWLVKEPQRNTTNKEKQKFWEILNIPLLWIVTIAAAFATFSAGALVFWLPTFLGKYHNFNAASGAITLGIIGISAGILGVLSGGAIGDWLYNKHVAGRAMVLAFAFLATIPFMIWGIFTDNRTEFLIATFFISYLMGWYHGPVAAIVGEIVPSHLRGTAIAFYMFGIHILGDTPSPVIIGKLSDIFGGYNGLRNAFSITIVANFLSGILFLVVIYFLWKRSSEKDLSYE